jgi:filamentous hemagglutinin family protein
MGIRIDRLLRLGITSAFTATGLLLGLGYCDSASAQSRIEPDETLGSERSAVTPNFQGTPNEVITGGATRGQNLFHSFREFNVETGRGAYFINLPGIENIFSRVTGSNRSEIDGILGTRAFENGSLVGSNASLFFINPNGIIFGPNSRLDIGGSFAATTADGIQFGENGFFSATDPEAPSQLLTIDPSAFFFNQLPGAIENNANVIGLGVPNGNSLILLGGDVSFNGGTITALENHVEVGGLAATGTVDLDINASTLQLTFPANVNRADVLFTNGAAIRVISADGGSISVNVRNIRLEEGSGISVFAGFNQWTATSQLGDVTINASGALTLSDASTISNSSFGSGETGNITISARSLNLINASVIAVNGIGQSNLGNISIQADTISLLGRNEAGTSSAIINTIVSADPVIPGRSGSITLQARQISLTDGGFVATSGVSNQSRTGNIQVTVTDSLDLSQGASIQAIAFRGGATSGGAGTITIDAGNAVSLSTDAQINTQSARQGNAGDILINAGNLVSLTSGARLISTTNGEGNSGEITIRSGDTVLIDGASSRNRSLIDSSVGDSGFTGSRRAGNITIEAPTLTVSNGGVIQSKVGNGTVGEAGDIILTADSIALINGGQIQSNLEEADSSNNRAGAQGRAGNVLITARDTLRLTGQDETGLVSGIFTSVDAGAAGTGGTIDIQTRSLFLTNSAGISASMLGQGNAGDIQIRATDDLIVRNGGQIQTLTRGQGEAGNIRIDAGDRVLFDGVGEDGLASGAFSTVESTGVGDGGTIRVTADSLSLTNNGQLVSSTRGQGDAGDVFVRADAIELRSGGLIQSAVAAGGIGDGGNVTIRGRSLDVLDGSQISTFVSRPQRDTETGIRLAGGQGEGGDIDIRTIDRITLTGTGSQGTFAGFSSGLLSLSERDALGPAGDITIQTRELQITDGAIVAAGIFNAGGDGGDIEIEADNLAILDGGQILTNTRSSGQAGRIRLDIADTITIAGRDENFATRREQVSRQIREQNLIDRVDDIVINEGSESGIFANTDTASTGDGGRIQLNATNLTMNNGAIISAQSEGSGLAGSVQLNVREQMQLNNSEIITSALNSSGGDIQVNFADGFGTGTIRLRGDSDITTNSQGNGGNITLRASSIIAFNDSDILARSEDARGGNINLQTDAFFGQGYQPSANGEGNLDGNNRVDVNADGELASGTITTPDTSLVQNSLTELPDTAIDTDTLVANSCVVRSENGNNTFTITGTGGLPIRPGDRPLLPYGTNPVRSIPDETSDRSWQPGEAIVEPQGVYQLEDGRMVLSRECS